MRIGVGSCQGTFGELVQGAIQERPFLITLPVASLRSTATFVPCQSLDKLISIPIKSKTEKACKLLLQRFHIHAGGYVYIQSNIPVGKGMASSSADMIAAMRAVADSYSLAITEEILSEIASKIEPTDGVMYEEIVSYDYKNGQLIERLGFPPRCLLIGFDTGGVVDTIQFNQRKKSYTSEEAEILQQAYSMARQGMIEQNFSLLCQASTTSASVNQRILPNPYFAKLKQIAQDIHGGVVIAHSGTVIGLLLNPFLPNINESLLHIQKQVSLMKTIAMFEFGSIDKKQQQFSYSV